MSRFKIRLIKSNFTICHNYLNLLFFMEIYFPNLIQTALFFKKIKISFIFSLRHNHFLIINYFLLVLIHLEAET